MAIFSPSTQIRRDIKETAAAQTSTADPPAILPSLMFSFSYDYSPASGQLKVLQFMMTTMNLHLLHLFALIKQYLVFLFCNIVYIIPSVATSEIVRAANEVVECLERCKFK